ncbi:MAG: AmmeMemoRadiSam system protein B [Treponema sp.]|nr:AmmeMemoRadiSam system protein B [Treponema sp.]
MQIREYSLQAGWFPRDSREVTSFLSPFSQGGVSPAGSSNAVIAPHAGWYYCGKIAARAISSLRQAETIVVLGGHLPPGSPSLFAMEDAVKTPFGHLPIDSELRTVLFRELAGSDDRYRDNTVEVLLPMVHYFFPKSKLLWLRLPAEKNSFNAGQQIAKAAAELNRKINVIASTDLTHYGPNYGFSPHGRGALRWVREVNDANFIKAVEAADADEVLRCAEEDHAACSAGAVLGAMGFASSQGSSGKARGGPSLLEYATSADVDRNEIPDSFVGYAAFVF